MKFLKSILIILIIAVLGATGISQAADAKPYPLQTCVVSGEKLGAMGKPYVLVYEGQEMKFCCKHCKKDFDKDPAKYIEKLQAAK